MFNKDPSAGSVPFVQIKRIWVTQVRLVFKQMLRSTDWQDWQFTHIMKAPG